MFEINSFLEQAVLMGASDMHLHVGEYPVMRRSGLITKMDTYQHLTEEDLDFICMSIAPGNIKDELYKVFDIDFSYEIPKCSRFRVNISRQRGNLAVAIRVVPYKTKTLKELQLPESIYNFGRLENGIVLLTGPTGSGKSTTMAAIIDDINENYQKHIITIEDPIEYVFNNKKSIISQRQLLIDTPTFADGVKYALRQDPDVILIGEIRDKETVTAALRAAETGHLVFSTIHTNNAIETINRIINMFNPVDRPLVRYQLGHVLRGTISQKLLKLESELGRVPAVEVLVVTPTVQDLICKNELEKVYDLVKSGSYDNMITLNDCLFKLVQDNSISQETALTASNNPNELRQMFRGVYHGTGN